MFQDYKFDEDKAVSVRLTSLPRDLAVSGMEWVLCKYLLNLLANDSVIVMVSGLTVVIYLCWCIY